MKNKHKKPAMALILIIIIITSVTVVIMGTLKILTAASGNYSVNRNAKGFVKIDKPLGRYICYKYNNELYQLMVNYDSDGNIIEENNNSELRPVTTCQFNITPEMNGLNVTLIGGGAGGGVKYFSGIDYRLHDINDRKGTSIYGFLTNQDGEEGNSNSLNKLKEMGFDLTVEYDFCGDKISNRKKLKYQSSISYDKSFDEYIEEDVLKKNKILCKNDYEQNAREIFLRDSCPEGYSDVDISTFKTDNNCVPKYKVSFCFDDNCNSVRSVEDNTLNPKTFEELLNSAFGSATADNNKKICKFEPNYLYTSVSPAPAGNVEKFSILKVDLQNREDKFFTICDSGCDGIIGNGGSFEKAGEETTFKYTTYLSNGGIENKSYTTNISGAVNSKTIYVENPRDDNAFHEPGKEPTVDISKDFNFKNKNLVLNAGYIKEEGDTTEVIPATLFGSSGAIFDAKNFASCSEKDDDLYKHSLETFNTVNPDIQCPLSNKTIPCEYKNFSEDKLKKFQGAPGAIIIEW